MCALSNLSCLSSCNGGEAFNTLKYLPKMMQVCGIRQGPYSLVVGCRAYRRLSCLWFRKKTQKQSRKYFVPKKKFLVCLDFFKFYTQHRLFLVLQKRNCARKSLGIKKLLPEKVSELVLFRFLGLMMLWRVGNLSI